MERFAQVILKSGNLVTKKTGWELCELDNPLICLLVPVELILRSLSSATDNGGGLVANILQTESHWSRIGSRSVSHSWCTDGDIAVLGAEQSLCASQIMDRIGQEHLRSTEQDD